jgi:4-hydroxybenzoate polyprenyltransferase
VTAVAAVLAVGAGLETWRVVLLGLAVLLNQASVGLSNDWIDADRDRAVGRTDKPVAQGLVRASTARNVAVAAVIAAIALTLPLGWAATLVHALFIGSAWAYNAGLKNSVLSVVPYIVSFGSLPLIITLASGDPRLAAPWALGAGALLGVSAHFANVLPDLDDDRATGVSGLPHRLGRRVSGVVIAVALAAASALVAFGPGAGFLQLLGFIVSLGIAAATIFLAVTRPPTRVLFQLIMAAAILNVAMLVAAGSALYA